MTSKETLGRVVQTLLAYRGWTSPEKLDMKFRPDPPVSGATIRRLMNGSYGHYDSGADFETLLVRLDYMLDLPPRTLLFAYQGDKEGVFRLEFSDPGVRQVVLDLMSPERPGRRRARG